MTVGIVGCGSIGTYELVQCYSMLSARVKLGRGGGYAEDYCMRMRAVPRSVYYSDVYGRLEVRVTFTAGD